MTLAFAVARVPRLPAQEPRRCYDPAVRPRADAVIAACAAEMHCSDDDVLSRRREPPMVTARLLATHLLMTDLGCILAEAGDLLGGRDHATMHYLVAKAARLAATERSFALRLARLRRVLDPRASPRRPSATLRACQEAAARAVGCPVPVLSRPGARGIPLLGQQVLARLLRDVYGTSVADLAAGLGWTEDETAVRCVEAHTLSATGQPAFRRAFANARERARSLLGGRGQGKGAAS